MKKIFNKLGWKKHKTSIEKNESTGFTQARPSSPPKEAPLNFLSQHRQDQEDRIKAIKAKAKQQKKMFCNQYSSLKTHEERALFVKNIKEIFEQLGHEEQPSNQTKWTFFMSILSVQSDDSLLDLINSLDRYKQANKSNQAEYDQYEKLQSAVSEFQTSRYRITKTEIDKLDPVNVAALLNEYVQAKNAEASRLDQEKKKEILKDLKQSLGITDPTFSFGLANDNTYYTVIYDPSNMPSFDLKVDYDRGPGKIINLDNSSKNLQGLETLAIKGKILASLPKKNYTLKMRIENEEKLQIKALLTTTSEHSQTLRPSRR